MSKYSCFRVIVNLSNFFHDHRSIARIFVKEENKTIQDLKNRISEVFKIDSFYLTSQNQYLPPTEDVRVLDKDEIIWAIKSENVDGFVQLESPVKTREKKKKNRNVSPEIEMPVKQKKKKRKREEIQAIPFEESFTKEPIVSEKNEVPTTHSKKKTKMRIPEESIKDQNEAMNNSDLPFLIGKKKLQSKQQEIDANEEERRSRMENIKSRIQNSIEMQKKSVANKTTPVKSTSFLTPPSEEEKLNKDYKCQGNLAEYTKMSTLSTNTDDYLSKKKINIVKIDIIPKDVTDDQEPPPDGFVKSVIDKIERNLSSGSSASEEKVETIEETQNTSESVVETPKNHSENSNQSNFSECSINISTAINYNISEGCFNKQPSNSAKKTDNVDAVTPKTSLNFTANVSENGAQIDKVIFNDHEIDLTGNNDEETPNNSLVKDTNGFADVSNNDTLDDVSFVNVRSAKVKKTFAGIGHVLETLKTRDSLDSDDSFVTKRKRKRVRKRKQKERIDTPIVKSAVAVGSKPHIVAKPPMLHIKFDEEGAVKEEERMVVEEEESGNVKEEEVVVLSDADECKAIVGLRFSKEAIETAPEMKNMLPKCDEYVAFKILRITEKYTPELSEYVLGIVRKISDDQKILLEILDGLDQLANPNGKFSISSESANEANIKYREFDWSEMIDCRLLFP